MARQADGRRLGRILSWLPARRGEEGPKRLLRLVHGAASSYRTALAEEYEDVVSDCVLEVLELDRRGRIRDTGGEAYVWRVVSHRCIDAIRRRRRQSSEPLSASEGDADGSSSCQSLEQKELAQRVWDAASSDCRDLWGRIADGQSFEDIARDLGTTPGALRVRASRCRKWARQEKSRISV